MAIAAAAARDGRGTRRPARRRWARSGSVADVPRAGSTSWSAGLAVWGVVATTRAELLQLHPVWVVAPVLARDVVALLALRTRHGDLGTDVGALCGHGAASLRFSGRAVCVVRSCRAGRSRVGSGVAGAGLEP